MCAARSRRCARISASSAGAGASGRRRPLSLPRPPEPAPASEPTGDAGAPAEGNEGARVIALNMALNGSTREETGRYLAENFELDDPEALLDDVYARAGG